MYFITTFQAELEKAEALMAKPGVEERPFDFKYEARELLNNLEIPEDSEHTNAAKAIVQYLLGCNHFESEEVTHSEPYYRQSLEHLLSLPKSQQSLYLNTFQDLYNQLGILECNREHCIESLAYFEKSLEVYRLMATVPDPPPVSNNFDDFMKEPSISFRFIIEGGVNMHKAEQQHTLTLFYMAQTYTKLEFKDKAASYCGETMRRQIISKDYDVKDWIINCINLSEFYVDANNLDQGLYFLQAGNSLLPPEELKTKKKLRATIHMQLGRFYVNLLEFGTQLKTLDESYKEVIHAKIIEYEQLGVPFPSVTPPEEVEAAKEVFREANQNLQKSLEFFIIDGWVTEHLELKREISEALRLLVYFEKNKPRIYAMLDKRIELLEPWVDEINKEAFSRLWQQLINEVATIYLDIFEMKKEQAKTKKSVNDSEWKRINLIALKGIERHMQLLEFVGKFEIDGSSAKDINQSSLNIMFSLAKTFSKLQSNEVDTKVEFMKSSLQWYEKILSFLRGVQGSEWSDSIVDINEHLRVADEMVNMLPVRISQINADR